MSDKETVEQEQPENTAQAEDTPDTEATAEATADPAAEWEQKYNDMHNKYLRMYSEFENFRRRTAKERIELVQTASADLIKELLPVLDDFDRASANNDKVDDAKVMREGFNLVHQKLLRILQAQGLQEMEAQGEAFDSELHEAIARIPAPSKKEKGKVVDVVEKGYTLNERILRYSKVAVGE